MHWGDTVDNMEGCAQIEIDRLSKGTEVKSAELLN